MSEGDFTARDFLTHMLQAADRCLQYTAGMSREQFSANTLVQDAVLRKIVGEAANNLLEVNLGNSYSVPQ